MKESDIRNGGTAEKDRGDVMVVNDRSDGKNHIYHVCTDGLSREIMFRDDSDYISGMNDIPICSLVTAIEVYCFCLMSNHVHFILNGTEYGCMEFIRKYKRLRSLRTRVRYGNKRVDDTPGISVKILDDAEYQMIAISYVIRNPLAAGLKMAPWHYPWSSSFLYFSQGYDLSGYRKVSELGCKEFRETLKTRLTVPDNYLVRHDGLIWPGSYVNYPSVEKIFGTPRRFLYYLSKNQDLENEISDGLVARSRYSDTELAASVGTVCQSRFRHAHPERLSIENRYILARELHRRYRASAKQIARVIGLDADILKALL